MPSPQIQIFNSIPVLELDARRSEVERTILSWGNAAVDVGEDYFMLVATDAWSTIRNGRFTILRGCNSILEFAIASKTQEIILGQGGLLVVSEAYDQRKYDSQELDGFLLGFWPEKPY